MQFLHRSSGSSRNSFEESKSVDKENEKVHLNKDNTSRLFPLTSLSLFHNIWSPMAASTSNSLYRQPSFSSLRSDSSKLFGDGSQQQQEASSSMNQFWHSAENFLASSFDHAMKLESSSSFAPIRKMDESESCDLLQAIAVETDQHNNKAEQIRTDFENNGRDLDLDDGVTFDPFSFSSPTFSRQIDDQPTRYTKGPATYNRRQQYMKTPENPVTSKNKLSKVKKYKYSLNNFCVFCKNNGAPESVYTNHTVKDSKGRALCPKLRVYKCPICGVDGDNAHTRKYCPMKPIITEADVAMYKN